MKKDLTNSGKETSGAFDVYLFCFAWGFLFLFLYLFGHLGLKSAGTSRYMKRAKVPGTKGKNAEFLPDTDPKEKSHWQWALN